jgi:DNA repair protein RecN (Recombination protein N)
LKNRISEIDKSSEEKNRRVDLLKYQITEIKAAKLEENEEEELLKDEHLLIHGEKAMENYNLVAELLSEGEDNILKSFSRILNSADKIESFNKDCDSAVKSVDIALKKKNDPLYFEQLASVANNCYTDEKKKNDVLERIGQIKLKKQIPLQTF